VTACAILDAADQTIRMAAFGSRSLGLRGPPDARTKEVVNARQEEWAVRLDNA
jgi:hypothetical protein